MKHHQSHTCSYYKGKQEPHLGISNLPHGWDSIPRSQCHLQMDQLRVQDKIRKRKVRPNTRNPVKVVYIGDPKTFQASAADFSALVQQLTGRHTAPVSLMLAPVESPESPTAHADAQDPGVLQDQLALPELQTSPDHGQEPLLEFSDFSMESYHEWILMLDASSPDFQSSSHL